jgi:hypothetical protein
MRTAARWSPNVRKVALTCRSFSLLRVQHVLAIKIQHAGLLTAWETVAFLIMVDGKIDQHTEFTAGDALVGCWNNSSFVFLRGGLLSVTSH